MVSFHAIQSRSGTDPFPFITRVEPVNLKGKRTLDGSLGPTQGIDITCVRDHRPGFMTRSTMGIVAVITELSNDSTTRSNLSCAAAPRVK